MRAAGYEPLEEYRSVKAKWRCRHVDCGKEVTPTLGQILRGQGGCKYCARTFVDPLEAVEVMRAAGYEPLEPYVNSGHKWRCLCAECGRETTPTYDEARIGSRCKFCARKALLPEDAIALMRASGFEPLEPYPGAMEPWMCRHLACGEIRFPRYAHVQQGRRACQTCSRTVMAEAFRLDPFEASRVMREAGLEPLEPYPGTNNTPWLCRHLECGSEVRPTYASIQQGQGGCKPCHQQRLARKYQTPNDQAVKVMRDAGFEPKAPYPGKNHAPWTSVHVECGREVSPALSNVKNGVGCKFCSDRGFDYDAPGVVYLLNHPDYQALKIGVTTQTAKNDRIKQHLRNGWKLSRSWETETGALAEVIETAIIGWWRDILGAPEALRSEEMPSGGHTETIAVLYVKPAEVEERVSALLAELNSPHR
jgi:hypothetical protein